MQRYTREAGVRQLEREVGKVARKAARRIADGAATVVEVTSALVRELLGRPKLHPEQKSGVDQVGTATGMYYTPMGGDIMFVEASSMRGKGELVLTGQLGDVMKESARAAWTYAKAHAAALHIPEEMFDRDLHIHVPAGAIPKDGPSAGITMATALVSALSGREVRHDIAMTGEVTLRGRVLPIGGVKEKLLGALRAGITRVICRRRTSPISMTFPKKHASGSKCIRWRNWVKCSRWRCAMCAIRRGSCSSATRTRAMWWRWERRSDTNRKMMDDG